MSDAIRAIRGVYSGVRAMLAELAGILEQSPAPALFDLGVRPRPDVRRSPDEKILRSWEGRFYSDEPIGGEADDTRYEAVG